MAVDLMASPVARAIVAQTSVTLPVAGTVVTYTPYLGDDGVIGVKSGRTSSRPAAASCWPCSSSAGPPREVLYSVVLGQRGGDLLGPAGTAALALGDSARDNEADLVYGAGVAVATVGWGHGRSPVVLTKTHSVWWWSGGRHLRVSVRLRTLRNRVRAGEVVGHWLQVGRRRCTASRSARCAPSRRRRSGNAYAEPVFARVPGLLGQPRAGIRHPGRRPVALRRGGPRGVATPSRSPARVRRGPLRRRAAPGRARRARRPGT